MNEQAKAMLEVSTYTEVTVRDDEIVARCMVCNAQRTFRSPSCLWDLLDVAASHQRTAHDRRHDATCKSCNGKGWQHDADGVPRWCACRRSGSA